MHRILTDSPHYLLLQETTDTFGSILNVAEAQLNNSQLNSATVGISGIITKLNKPSLFSPALPFCVQF